MEKNELRYYSNLANWDFSNIKCKTEKITQWDFYEKIKSYTNKNSLCLDIGTGGGEKVLKKYPKVGMIIATDFSEEMIKTAKQNAISANRNDVKFVIMDSLKMTFPNNLFDLVSARHTKINAKQIYDCLKEDGTLVIEGIDKKDCLELKELFGRGQAYNDKISIAEQDYKDLLHAGFSKIERIEVVENEYFETPEDLMALLLKVPILDDFSEFDYDNFKNNNLIEEDLFNDYVRKKRNKKGILLKRVLYGIIAKK